MKDLISSLIVIIILSTVLLFTKKIFKNTTAEQSRKIIHITMGLVSLSFPYIFESFIPVIILGILSFISLFALRKIKSLNLKFGEGLYSVKRKSYGELYFAFSIVLIFTLYKVMNLNVVHYLIPISTLTFADSAAALIGLRYGQKKLSSLNEDTKSLEGSFIFFIVAFMCALVPLQLMTQVGRLEVLLLATFSGILSAMIEMTSHDGNDNFFLPFLVFLIIQHNFSESASTLINIFIIILFLIYICMIIKLSTRISKLAIASVLLYGYMTLILGSMNWLYIPLLVFVFFSIFPRTTKQEKENEINYLIIEYNVLVGTIFVYIKSLTGLTNICFLCFLVSYCMSLCMNTYIRLALFKRFSDALSIFLSILKTVLTIEIPWILFNAYFYQVYRWWDWIIALCATIISAFTVMKLCEKIDYSYMNTKAAVANCICIGIVCFLIFGVYLVLGGTGCIILS